MVRLCPPAWILALALIVSGLHGCAHPYAESRASRRAPADPMIIRPVVAVTDFENRANFSGQWNLGGGMAEMLIERLMNSEEVVVLERQHLDSVMGELVRQGRDLFRREGRAEQGRLMNARYLIRGVVTDFTVTGDASGWFGSAAATARLRGSRARVGLYVTVSDVETGQIISAVRTEGSARQGGLAGAINYKQVSFGGDAYFRTPLGKATQQAMNRAVRRVLTDLPRERWEPRVAEAGVDYIIINGGQNVGVRLGQRFAVREPGRRITDPITGEVIEHMPGRVVGTLEVHTVQPASSHATLVDGKAQRGDLLQVAP